MITALVIFLFASFGLTNAITREVVFERTRNWVARVFPYSMLNKVIHCETCCSFYVGMGLSWLAPHMIDITLLNVVTAGLIASGFTKVLLMTLLKF